MLDVCFTENVLASDKALREARRNRDFMRLHLLGPWPALGKSLLSTQAADSRKVKTSAP